MKNKDKKRPLKKEQLLSETSFIRFCNEDPTNTSGGGRMKIFTQFLRSAEKDNLLKPLLIEEQIIKKNDVETKDLIYYYSPHQLYVLGVLQNNTIDEDGNLQSPDTIHWYKDRPKEQRPRYIQWGHSMSFSAESLKNKIDDQKWLSPNVALDYLHNFLELIHSFEPRPLDRFSLSRQRYWKSIQVSEYDFDLLKKNGKKILKIYHLDDEKLEKLRASIGHFAKHGDAVGAKSVSDYYSKANAFIDNGFTHRFKEGADTVYYNSKTNYAAYTNKKGDITSFYEITNKDKIKSYKNRTRARGTGN